jgi:hypothetical protein
LRDRFGKKIDYDEEEEAVESPDNVESNIEQNE